MNEHFEPPKVAIIDTLSADTGNSLELSRDNFSIKSENQFESLTGATIMMVDDEPINTDMVQMFLEEEGYKHFITIQESAQAFDLIAKKQPDVVLLDLIMPEVNGFEILTRVRANEKLKYTPIIILTSSTDADTKLKALRLGANDFLGKPVDPSELVYVSEIRLPQKYIRTGLPILMP